MDMDDGPTAWCGNLPPSFTEELLYELFLQVAPLKKVRIPTDNKTGKPNNYGFVTFKHDVSLDYAVRIMDGTRLNDRVMRVRSRNAGGQNQQQQQQQQQQVPNNHHAAPQPEPPNNNYRNFGRNNYRNDDRRGNFKYQDDGRYGGQQRFNNNRGGGYGHRFDPCENNYRRRRP